jgi:hypothetical protein
MKQLKLIHEFYRRLYSTCEIKVSFEAEKWVLRVREEKTGGNEVSGLGATPEDAIVEAVFALIHVHRHNIVRDATLITLVSKLLKELNVERPLA